MDTAIIIGIAAVAALLAFMWAISRGKGRRGRGSDGYDGGAAVIMGADSFDDPSSCDAGDSGGGDSGGGDCGGGDGGGGGD